MNDSTKAVGYLPEAVKSTMCEIRDGRVVTSSLKVAEIFIKEHYRVLRAIRNLDCTDEFRAANFGVSEYTQDYKQGGSKKLPMYYLTRDGFVFLVMGFTGQRAARFKEAYINAFNKMEAELRGETSRQRNAVTVQTANVLQASDEWMKAATKVLHLTDQERDIMLNKEAERMSRSLTVHNGEQQRAYSASVLIRRFKWKKMLSAKLLNKRMMALGAMREVAGNKTLVDWGLFFGYNRTCPWDSSVTWPVYYDHMFKLLIIKLSLII